MWKDEKCILRGPISNPTFPGILFQFPSDIQTATYEQLAGLLHTFSKTSSQWLAGSSSWNIINLMQVVIIAHIGKWGLLWPFAPVPCLMIRHKCRPKCDWMKTRQTQHELLTFGLNGNWIWADAGDIHLVSMLPATTITSDHFMAWVFRQELLIIWLAWT